MTHVSFPAARRICQLAGGAPRFLMDYLANIKPKRSYIDVSEFRRKEQQKEELSYFRKTNLADCDDAEFKKLFGLVSHEEAFTIREKAKLSKKRSVLS